MTTGEQVGTAAAGLAVGGILYEVRGDCVARLTPVIPGVPCVRSHCAGGFRQPQAAGFSGLASTGQTGTNARNASVLRSSRVVAFVGLLMGVSCTVRRPCLKTQALTGRPLTSCRACLCLSRVRVLSQSYEHYERVRREREQQGLPPPPPPTNGALASHPPSGPASVAVSAAHVRPIITLKASADRAAHKQGASGLPPIRHVLSCRHAAPWTAQ